MIYQAIGFHHRDFTSSALKKEGWEPQDRGRKKEKTTGPCGGINSLISRHIWVWTAQFFFRMKPVNWWVVWNMNFIFPYIYIYILGMSSQLTFTPSFFRGLGQPPTSFSHVFLYQSPEIFKADVRQRLCLRWSQVGWSGRLQSLWVWTGRSQKLGGFFGSPKFVQC